MSLHGDFPRNVKNSVMAAIERSSFMLPPALQLLVLETPPPPTAAIAPDWAGMQAL
jgi:hypothetical protein